MALQVKNQPANAGDAGDVGSIPGSGRSPGGGNGHPLQDPCLKKSNGQRSLAGIQSMGSQRTHTTEHKTVAPQFRQLKQGNC